MTVLEFSELNLPSAEEFRRLWQQADEDYDPLEDLLRLERELALLEAEHELDSAEFFSRYQAGEVGDEIAYVTWAGRYRLYMNLRHAISESLRLVVTVADVPLS